MYDCRRFCARVVVVILMQRVVVSSQYDGLVFAFIMRCLFVFWQFEWAKYIRSKTINQINGCQYATELELNVF